MLRLAAILGFKNLYFRLALTLGNDVTALHSVPSAIYSALRIREEDILADLTENVDNKFEK